jgi:dTDP-4-dehydrorhamnose reductase
MGSDDKKLNVTIVGAGGQLGRMCAKLATTRITDCGVRALFRDGLDLTWGLPEMDHAVIHGGRPDVIINCAAFNDVDGAESDMPAAMEVNYRGTERLASICREYGIMLIHFCTDYVFNGVDVQWADGWQECSVAHPLNVYGKSKQSGTSAVQDMMEDRPHYVLRTAALWSNPAGPHESFPAKVIGMISGGDTMQVVDNRFMNPTHVQDVAEAVMVLINMRRQGSPAPYGLYNFTCSGAASPYEFARAVVEETFDGNAQHFLRATNAFPSAANRPRDSRLDCTKWVKATGLTPRHWRAAVSEHIETTLPVPENVPTD